MRLLLLLALVGCPTPDTGDSDPRTEEDRDGDGVENEEDCAPDDPLIEPGITDGCDQIDNDCDGEVDEDTTKITWYRDQDADGYGDPGWTQESCVQESGWVLDNSDCGGSDPLIYPDAVEYCDGLDHDCDGLTLEADSVDPSPWWTDADGDGFGSGEPAYACAALGGTVGNGDDCDDTRSDVSPRAPEVCDDDNVDEDCDLLADDLDFWTAGGTAWYPDYDGDGWGAIVDPIWTCDAPRDHVGVTLDCDDADDLLNPGMTETCNRVDDDCDGTVDLEADNMSTWYIDADRDGWGEESTTYSACEEPLGYAGYSGDCDDYNNTIHPSADESECEEDADLNCDGYTGGTDHDGDGFGACLECDDGDAAVFPGAEEVCNEIDDDCDGEVDVDATGGTVFYADDDGDGYGNPEVAVDACEGPVGYVEDNTDCDDTTRSTHPGAAETCATEGDDDCNGEANEVDAIACTDWYADYDEDLWGGASVCLCEASGVYTLDVGEDCNDLSAEISPSAVDVCSDSIDQDCDGADASCTTADADAVVTGRAADDGFGASIGTLGDVDGDGKDDSIIGGTGVDRTADEGGVLLMRGAMTGTANYATAVQFWSGENLGDKAGAAVSDGFDWDDDGTLDVLIAAPRYDGRVSNAGVVYVASVGSGVSELASSAYTISGETAHDQLGTSLQLGADYDGDGVPDVVVTAQGNDENGAESGAVYLFDVELVGDVIASRADYIIRGSEHDRLSILPRHGADVDGDGQDDLVVGAWGADGGGAQSGGVYVFAGPLTGSLGVADADHVLEGAATDDEAGVVLDLRDADLDGYADLAVGAPGHDGVGVDAGVAYLVYGPLNRSLALSSADAVIEPEAAGDGLGRSVAWCDPLGGGSASFFVGAPGQDDAGSESGAVYQFNAPVLGSIEAAAADGTYEGTAGDAAFGTVLGSVGDHDGDGLEDLGVSAPGYLDSLGVLGAVFVL